MIIVFFFCIIISYWAALEERALQPSVRAVKCDRNLLRAIYLYTHYKCAYMNWTMVLLFSLFGTMP